MNEPPFLPLPEDLVPQYAEECSRCELHKQRTRIIWGEGYPGAPLIVLLDNPGARENNEGKPFVCGTRQTLQRLAVQAGIALEQLYITYVVKCRPLRSYYKKQARTTCLEYFYTQVTKQNPQAILCLGNIALQALLNDEAAEVKNFRGLWHSWNGLPMAASYHPLAVRRRPNLFPYALKDWEMVSKRLQVTK